MNPHWISNSGLWKVVLETFHKQSGNPTKGVLFHQDNAPAHKSVVAMAAVRDCGIEVVDHPPYSPELAPSDYSLFPNMKKKNNTWLGSSIGSNDEVISAVEDFFEDQDENFYIHRNPSIAAPMEEVCGPQERLCWKINQIWSHSTIASESAYKLFSLPSYIEVKCSSYTQFYGARSFQSSAPELWNNIPDKIKTSKTIDQFKAALKTHYFMLNNWVI